MGGHGGSLGIALTIIFVISLLILFAQIFYALWRRRVFRRQTHAGGGAEHLSSCSSSDSAFTCKNNDRSLHLQLDMEIVDIDLLKLQGLFGPPRFLFTIKEEEREGLESPADKSMHSAEKEAKKIGGYDRKSVMSLEECFAATDSAVELEAGGAGDDATPSSTSCSSPRYLRPRLLRSDI